MIIDPIVYGNLMLTAIAVILFLLLIAIVILSRRLKTAFPAVKKETVDVKEKPAEKKKEKQKETDPAELYTSESIEENLRGLFKHYKLNSFTMATSDGLVISSTESDPDMDAANYSYLYLEGQQPESPNVRLIGVPHKGGTVVGIIKSDDELSDNDLVMIERDIRFILRRNL